MLAPRVTSEGLRQWCGRLCGYSFSVMVVEMAALRKELHMGESGEVAGSRRGCTREG